MHVIVLCGVLKVTVEIVVSEAETEKIVVVIRIEWKVMIGRMARLSTAVYVCRRIVFQLGTNPIRIWVG